MRNYLKDDLELFVLTIYYCIVYSIFDKFASFRE
jgi:hypothetical protein